MSLRAKLAAVALLGAALLLPRLGERAIFQWDEGHYVGLLMEAQASGDWVVARQEGQPFPLYDKPPMAHWLTGLSAAVFGDNKVAFRLPWALAVLAALLVLVALGERLTAGAGVIAALCLLSAPGFVDHARRIWVEHVVVLCDLAAFYLYSRDRTDPRWWRVLAVGLLLGAALFTKQLAAGLGLAAIGIAELFLGPRRWRRLLIVCGLAAAPLAAWFLALAVQLGPEAPGEILSITLGRRLLAGLPEQARHAGDYLASWLLFLGPGVTALGIAGLGGLLVRARRLEEKERPLLTVALLYVALSVAVFGLLSRSFRIWYPFPAAWILALAAGVAVMWLREQWATLEHARAWPAALLGFVAFGAAQAPKPLNSMWPLAAGGFATVALLLVQRLRPRGGHRLFLHLPAAGLALVLAHGIAGGFSEQVLRAPPDEVERLSARLLASGVDLIVAEPRYVRNEFLYYLKGANLRRMPRGNACLTPPSGARYAYLALDREPTCWQELRGERGHVRDTWYLIMDGR